MPNPYTNNRTDYLSLFSVASQSERDHYRYLRRQTNARVLRSCSGEMEREVHAILGPLGVDERLCRQVAQNLMHVELENNSGDPVANGDTSDIESSGLRWSKEVGLTLWQYCLNNLY